MQLTHGISVGLAIIAMMLTGASARKSSMDLGNFSVSLAVKDLDESKAFYEKLGFVQVLGDAKQGWAIMKNGSTNVGLFHGMFERNTLTFNPGWNADSKAVGKSEDVRNIQKGLREAGIATGAEIDSVQGPASFTVTDPDGNPILIDQHI